MRNASLRARKMFYFCYYADGAVATAMRRYTRKCYISTSHAPNKVLRVCRSVLMCAQTGRSQLRQRCIATRTERLFTTVIRRYALRTHKTQNVVFYFDFTRPKAPLGGMGRRARWHSLRTAGKTIHDKRAETIIIIRYKTPSPSHENSSFTADAHLLAVEASVAQLRTPRTDSPRQGLANHVIKRHEESHLQTARREPSRGPLATLHD